MVDTESIRNRSVCYLDLMGFSSAVNRASNNTKEISGLVSLLEKIESDVLSGYEDSRLSFQNLSDSIFIATESNAAEDIEQLFMCVQNIYLFLLQNKFLVRGGISSGICSVTPSIVVGKPVVHAVKLEQHVALTPRVIVGGSTVNFLRKEGVGISNLCRGDDGIFWINPFPIITRPIIAIHRAIKSNGNLKASQAAAMRNDRDEKIEILNNISSFISEMIESITEEEKLYRRYFWIGKVLQESISECRNVVGESINMVRFDV